jgi:hypothetical protein
LWELKSQEKAAENLAGKNAAIEPELDTVSKSLSTYAGTILTVLRRISGIRMRVKIFIARWVSIIGYPFALIVLLMLLVLSARGGMAVAFRIAAIVVAAGIIPM